MSEVLARVCKSLPPYPNTTTSLTPSNSTPPPQVNKATGGETCAIIEDREWKSVTELQFCRGGSPPYLRSFRGSCPVHIPSRDPVQVTCQPCPGHITLLPRSPAIGNGYLSVELKTPPGNVPSVAGASQCWPRCREARDASPGRRRGPPSDGYWRRANTTDPGSINRSN